MADLFTKRRRFLDDVKNMEAEDDSSVFTRGEPDWDKTKSYPEKGKTASRRGPWLGAAELGVGRRRTKRLGRKKHRSGHLTLRNRVHRGPAKEVGMSTSFWSCVLDSSSENPFGATCAICLGDTCAVVMAGCGHMYCCKGCAEREAPRAVVDGCAICRGTVTAVHTLTPPSQIIVTTLSCLRVTAHAMECDVFGRAIVGNVSQYPFSSDAALAGPVSVRLGDTPKTNIFSGEFDPALLGKPLPDSPPLQPTPSAHDTDKPGSDRPSPSSRYYLSAPCGHYHEGSPPQSGHQHHCPICNSVMTETIVIYNAGT